MHLLTEATISSLLTTLSPSQAHEFLHILAQSLASLQSNNHAIHQPHRTSIVTENSTALFMPVSNTATTGIKIVTVPRGRRIAGVINLFSPDGELLGLLGAAEITAFRTAMVTMTMFVKCPPGIQREHIVVFGSGRQAEWHARLALLLTAPGEIKSITFVNRGRERLDILENKALKSLRDQYPGVQSISTLAQEDNKDYETTLQSTLANSDIIFSCTPSTDPNFPSYFLQTSPPKQRFIGLIGSYKPHMQEIDTETLMTGDGVVYVDSKAACLVESGELIRAGVTESQLVEVGEVYSGSRAVHSNGNLVFKCVGMGIMDLTIAQKVLDVAVEKGLGMHVDGFA